jgi:hypothetical protein
MKKILIVLTSILLMVTAMPVSAEKIDYASMTSLFIPADVTDTEVNLNNHTSLTEITVDENNEYFAAVDGVLFDKSLTTLIRYPAGRSGDYVIPDSVTAVDSFAFVYCSKLTSVKISENVSTFGMTMPFMRCTSLTEITVDENNEYFADIDGVLFDKSLGILITYPAGRNGGYVIPDKTTRINNAAFDTCSGLTEITIPYGVTEIGGMVFYNCTSLKEVVIPESVTSFYAGIFSGCTSLTSVTIPSGIEMIRPVVFRDCVSLTDIVIPDSVTEIYEDVFEGCKSLIIRGSKGSYAEVFANEQGIPFVPIESGENGDLDASGAVGMTDIVILAKIVHTRGTVSEELFSNADLSDDGVVNSIDLAILKSMLIG